MPLSQSSGVFSTTRWTRVLEAKGETPEARLALSELCEAYWSPVHWFLLREGRDAEEARALTQEFFARILTQGGFDGADPNQGRFRSFLLGAVKHFLSDHRDREQALKRGRGIVPQSLSDFPLADSDTGAGIQIADARATVPDTHFDRQWALSIMERSLAQLSREWADEGKSAQFALLKPWLIGTDVGSQSEAARALHLTEGAVKVAIHRLRKRFRALVRSEIMQTVPTSADVDAEIRYLVEVLSSK